MGFSFRRSKSFGGLRLNLSNRGVGFSLGRRGARLSVDSRRRKTISLGAFGLRWRKRL